MVAMRLILAITLLLIFAQLACSQVQPTGPFKGVNLSSLSASDRSVILMATEDFESVKSGRPPKHATLDKRAPVPADGGTEFYVGNKYKLEVQKSLSTLGTLTGFIYGPILTFDKSFAPGNSATITGVRFYTMEQMRKLLE
jgi:hypothetical protein